MRLHIANLSPKINEAQLKQLFGKYGEILKIELSWVKIANRTSGNALIEMHPADALAAARALNGHAFRNRKLYIFPIADSSAAVEGPRMKEDDSKEISEEIKNNKATK